MTKIKSIVKVFFKKDVNSAALLICLFFIVAGILVSLNRYWQYEVYYVDFGVYDQAIWEVSHFKPPVIDHFVLGEKLLFADHFAPSVFLISPLYWFTQRSEILLIVQAIAVGLSGLVLYQIGKNILKNNFLSLSVMIAYFLFVGLQNAVITEFHEITVMTLPFMLTFWAIVKKKPFLYILFLIITLGFKEVTFTLGICMGITLFFIRKEWWKISLFTIFLSVLWGILSMKFVIPYFSGGDTYLYSTNIPQDTFGKITALFDNPLKRSTIFYSFFSFGFLPILSPSFWPLIIQDYSIRFLPKFFNIRWSLGMHYNSVTAVILAVSSIYSLNFLKRFKFTNKIYTIIAILLILNSFILNRFILNGPFNMVLNPVFYKHTSDFKFLDNLVKKIPSNSSVMAQNNLAAKLTHQKVWLLNYYYEPYKPDYVFIDNRQGQSPNNYFPLNKLEPIISKLNIDKNYSLIYQTKEQFIYKRNNQN